MKAPVSWTLVGASVLLLGFVSLQVTDAAWRDSETTAGDTIRTGHLRITGPGQVALDLSGLTKENMNTGDRAQVPLRVVNDSTIPVNYRLEGVTARVSTTPPAVDLRVARVSDASACPTSGPLGTPGAQVYSGAITRAVTTDTALATGATDVLCLTTTAQTVTPGQSGRYVFTFRAAQR
ncbi:hypothetical protein [Dietzia sp. B32]|uniref:hypothetical protein n=1 Tax=Dietzia sp. B32 TaxID=2915130 RepID=UPI0021AD676E|nr:hypothetical protein [Dietzia sp. B32]UVE96392.1 hypothetical protein L8M95_06380 [Dietzia sp. B32]